jgi:hypothetical protein
MTSSPTLRGQPAAQNGGVLVLALGGVHRRAELTSREVVLHKGEGATGRGRGEHAPSSQRLVESHVLAVSRGDLRDLQTVGSFS